MLDSWVWWVLAGVGLVTLLPRFTLWLGLLAARPEDLLLPLERADQTEAWWAALVEPTLVELESLGFVRAAWLEIVTPNAGRRVPAALAHDAAGEVFVIALPAAADRVDRAPVSIAALTLSTDGRWFETGRNSVVIQAPSYDYALTTEATTAGLLAAHRARLQDSAVALGVHELLASIARIHQTILESMQARGAWVDVGGGDLRLSVAEAWRLVSAAVARTPSGRIAPGPIARVPAELDLLLRARAQARPSLPRRRALALTLASGVALLTSLAALWDPRSALITTAVVVFHELGHALAMRALGWRDATVFFVPFLGGVAVGKPQRASPWRELGVLLAGPLPGIVAGLLALFSTETPWVRELALIAIGINVFNLLPLHPLDGGRIVHHFLWGRYPRVDVVMRFVAAAVLLVAAVWSADWVLGIFSGLFLLDLPARWARVRSLGRVDQARRDRPDVQLEVLALEVLAASPEATLPHARRLAFVGEVEAQHAARAVPRATSALALAVYAALITLPLVGAGMTAMRRWRTTADAPALATFRPPADQPWAWPESMASALEPDPPSMLHLRCATAGADPDVAQVVDHFALPLDVPAAAPWRRPLTPDEVRARQQWRQMDVWYRAVAEAMPPPDLAGLLTLEAEDAEATRRALEQIRVQTERREKLVREELRALVAREGGTLEPAVVDAWWAARGAPDEFGDADRSRARAAVGRLVGVESATRAATLFGAARLDREVLVVEALGGEDVEAGVRELVGWLQQRRCGDVRLELTDRLD